MGMKPARASRILKFYWKFFIRRIMKLPPEILVVSFIVIYSVVMFSFVGFLIRQDSEEELSEELPKPGCRAALVCDSEEELPKGFVEVPGVSIEGDEHWIPESSVFVTGRSLYIPSLLMSDHEVTRAEWEDVISLGKPMDKKPVDVSRYGAIAYCNFRSLKEGLDPCYSINGYFAPDLWEANGLVRYDDLNGLVGWDKIVCNFNLPRV